MFHPQDPLKGALPPAAAARQLFHCQDCGKQYNTQLGYRRHLAASHGATAGPACRDEAPPPHMQDRPPPPEGGVAPVRERKYSCERCDRRFYTRKDVRRHAVVHTGRRDFLCPRCAQRFGRRDHLTRHLKKSHAQEAGLASPNAPPAANAALCPVKEEPGPATPDAEPMEGFASYPMPNNAVPGMAPPHGLMQGALPAAMGPQPPHPLHHHMQPPAAPQQQPYGGMPRYQHGSTSYPRSDMDSFLLDLQSAPPPHLGAVNSSTSASPPREAPGDAAELSCTANMDLGPLLGFLPFGLPPYSPHMGMGGLVMSYPPATSTSAAASSPPSSSAGLASQAAGPFTFFQPPQPHGPQGPAVHNHSQLPQAYSPGMSAPSSLPHYYQAFQQ